MLNERNLEERLTALEAARVQGLAGGDEIWMSADVYSAPDVADLLAPHAVKQTKAELKGIEEALPVYWL